jgi:hypothetical protein
MRRYDPRRLKFEHWAMQVHHRGWAALSVVFHRLQRLTVLSRAAWVGGPPVRPGQHVRHVPGHRWINHASCTAFERATTD